MKNLVSFRGNGSVTLLTDFGTSDSYVAQMKAVMLAVSPALRFIDITHDIGPQDVAQGAFLLQSAAAWFPRGTVHLAVVDPGVGSPRAAVVLVAGGHAFVGPDNGLLLPAARALGGELPGWELVNVPSPGETRSATFHGRDLFAPAAALLASGERAPSDLGPRLARLPHSIAPSVEPGHERVLHIDHFGNLITSLPASALPGLRGIEVRGQTIDTIVATYAEAPGEAPVLLAGSSGRIEISVAFGSAARELGVEAAGVRVFPLLR